MPAMFAHHEGARLKRLGRAPDDEQLGIPNHLAAFSLAGYRGDPQPPNVFVQLSEPAQPLGRQRLLLPFEFATGSVGFDPAHARTQGRQQGVGDTSERLDPIGGQVCRPRPLRQAAQHRRGHRQRQPPVDVQASQTEGVLLGEPAVGVVDGAVGRIPRGGDHSGPAEVPGKIHYGGHRKTAVATPSVVRVDVELQPHGVGVVVKRQPEGDGPHHVRTDV